MKKFLQLSTAILLIAATSNAQIQIKDRGCATGIPGADWEAQFQQQIEAFKAAHTLPNGKTQMVNYTIPVIVHVIHGGEPVGTYPNLAQGQINSQIVVLNADYAGVGLNVGNYPATAFSSYVTAAGLTGSNVDGSGRVAISNTGISFCMATQDTLGNTLAEPGIERINYVTEGWSNPTSFTNLFTFQSFINSTVKPATIWNVSKYLNIWVTDENSGVGLLGFATFPVSSSLAGLSPPYGTSSNDGFWSFAKSFGSNNIYPAGTYIAVYDKGRTCTHEIGHWLGLRHIWGDAGQCAASDYCVDTPPQKGTVGPPAGCYYGTPSYPQNANTCTRPDGTASANVSNVNGDMFMNFMDYTDDVAMYMFTTDQATRMQTAMANSPYRKFLGTHGLSCIDVGINETPSVLNQRINLMPNPSSGQLNIVTNLQGAQDLNITVTNALGQVITNSEFKSVNNQTITLDLTSKENGVYFITISNGTERVVKKVVIAK